LNFTGEFYFKIQLLFESFDTNFQLNHINEINTFDLAHHNSIWMRFDSTMGEELWREIVDEEFQEPNYRREAVDYVMKFRFHLCWTIL
jgi:hypothetical protein